MAGRVASGDFSSGVTQFRLVLEPSGLIGLDDQAYGNRRNEL